MKKSKEEGITLIALIITIIVLLILLYITVSIAIRGGLFKKAGEAVVDYNNAQNNELSISAGLININGEMVNANEYANTFSKVDGGTDDTVPIPNEMKIGDIITISCHSDGPTSMTVPYNGDNVELYNVNIPAGERDIDWYVVDLDTEQNIVTLIPEGNGNNRVVSITNHHYLDDNAMYTVEIDIMEDICSKFYSNPTHNLISHPMNLEDVKEFFHLDVNIEETYEYPRDGYPNVPSLILNYPGQSEPIYNTYTMANYATALSNSLFEITKESPYYEQPIIPAINDNALDMFYSTDNSGMYYKDSISYEYDPNWDSYNQSIAVLYESINFNMEAWGSILLATRWISQDSDPFQQDIFGYGLMELHLGVGIEVKTSMNKYGYSNSFCPIMRITGEEFDLVSSEENTSLSFREDGKCNSWVLSEE